MFAPPPGGATGTVVHRLDATRFLQTSNRQNTQFLQTDTLHYQIVTICCFSEHWKLVAESSELHLTMQQSA